MSSSKEIIANLQQELLNKRNQRDSLISRLTLLDIDLDKYTNLVSKIDEDAKKTIKIINDYIVQVKLAYDARISAGCRSDLVWVFIESWAPNSEFSVSPTESLTYYKYEVKKNINTYSYIPYRGIKYYKKPLDREYGSNIVAGFSGAIDTNSNVIAVTFNENLINNISTGDLIVDTLGTPSAIPIIPLPTVIGFGVTERVGLVTTLVGGISSGSTIFQHYGSGVSSVGIITGMRFQYQNLINSSIVGFGTTSVNITYLNTIGGYSTSSLQCNSLILDSPASQNISEAEFTVGIVAKYPAIFISTVANTSTENTNFSAIRQNTVQLDFDYTQNPFEPLSIGVVSSETLGVGYSAYLDSSGSPTPTQTWSPSQSYFDESISAIVNPEPSVGAGRAEFYFGTFSWPIFRDCSDILLIGCASSIAPEGTVAITTSIITTGIGSTTQYSAVGLAYTSNIGIATDGVSCNQLQQNIDDALSTLTVILAQNSPILEPLIGSTNALRRDRDRKQLEAWSVLQGIGGLTENISTLEQDIDELERIDFTSYETE